MNEGGNCSLDDLEEWQDDEPIIIRKTKFSAFVKEEKIPEVNFNLIFNANVKEQLEKYLDQLTKLNDKIRGGNEENKRLHTEEDRADNNYFVKICKNEN